jgi:hypothetical protein
VSWPASAITSNAAIARLPLRYTSYTRLPTVEVPAKTLANISRTLYTPGVTGMEYMTVAGSTGAALNQRLDAYRLLSVPELAMVAVEGEAVPPTKNWSDHVRPVAESTNVAPPQLIRTMEADVLSLVGG